MILESPLFKQYKPIKEKTEKLTKELDFLTEYIIKTSFMPVTNHRLVTLTSPVNDKPFRPEMPEWIKCTYRIRQPLKKGKTESFCLNPFHPFASHYGIWVPICFKGDCELHKICDDDPLIL